MAKAVTATTGMAFSSASSFSHLVTSRPDTSGKLDIHQDQVGPVLAREIQRLDPVAGADGLVAVRLQQIVEELHVELVVLHDQDSLGHSPPLLGHFHPAQRQGIEVRVARRATRVHISR